MKEAILDFSTIQGPSTNKRVIALTLLFIGFVPVYLVLNEQLPRWGFLLMFAAWGLSVHFAFYKTGMEIMVRRQKLRFYSTLFGMKIGKWISIQRYPYIALRQVNLVDKYNMDGQVQLAPNNNPDDQLYKIVLVSRSTKHRITLQEFEDRLEAEAFLHKIKMATKLKIHPEFGEKISEENAA